MSNSAEEIYDSLSYEEQQNLKRIAKRKGMNEIELLEAMFTGNIDEITMRDLANVGISIGIGAIAGALFGGLF